MHRPNQPSIDETHRVIRLKPQRPEQDSDVVRFKHVVGWLAALLLVSGSFAGWVTNQMKAEAIKADSRLSEHMREEAASHNRIESKVDRITDLILRDARK